MGGFFKRGWLLFILIILGVLLVVISVFRFYSYNKPKSNSTEKDKKTIKIGLSMDSLVVERWQTDRDVFVAKARELGADVIVQKANNNTEEQIRQVKYLIDEGVDVLVIIPHDSDAFAYLVSMAKRKGIKVIAYDRLIKNASSDLYVSFDNELVGKLIAKAIVEKVPNGNYVIINGGSEDSNAHYYEKGAMEILKPYIEDKRIKIIKEVWANDWREDVAYNTVDSVLESGENIDGIICGNDGLAEAAIKALSERRLAGKVVVGGQDASLSGCQRIVEGTQQATVYKPIGNLAIKAAEYAVSLANGEFPVTNEKIFDGKEYIPFHMEKPILVDKANMVDVVVKDNFHTIDEIYKNIPKEQWPKQ